MANGDVVCRPGYGTVRYYASLPAPNDALVLVLLKLAGLEDDETLRDYQSLAAMLAGSSDECTATNYQRLLITSGITATYTDGSNRVDVDIATDPTFPAVGDVPPAAGQQVGAVVICYDQDTTTGDDTTVLPLVKLKYLRTLDGSNAVVQLAQAGFYRGQGL